MAGFAAAIGGAAGPLIDYGQRMRGIFEERRNSFANLLAQRASNEVDPQRQAELYGHVSDLLGGKDMSKIVPAAIKTLQAHTESDHALGQMLGGPPQQPTPQPGPAPPGQTPGTPNFTPIGGSSPVAAQPATSPVQPQAQQPPAFTPPVGAPQPQSVADIYRKYSTLPEWQTQAGFARLKPLMDQEIAHNEALRQGTEQLATALAYKRAGLQSLKSNKELWDNLMPYQKAAYEAEASGMSPVSMPGFAMLPRLVASRAVGKDYPGVVEAATGQPLDPKKEYRIMEHMGTLAGYPIEAQTAFTQTPGGLQVSNRLTGDTMAPVTGAVPPSMNAVRTAPTAGGGVEQFTPAGVQAGISPVTVPGAVAPAMLPSVSNTYRMVQTVENGVPVTRLEPVQTSTSKVAPQGGAPAPVSPKASGTPSVSPVTPPKTSGEKSFVKPFTPEQMVKHQQQLEQYNLAINRMQNIRGKLTLLDSMLNSGKLALETDSNHLIRAIVNRAMPLTPSEAEFVGDFRTMMEDINLLRGPMGATGFRGPEAWQALQAQRGQLLAKPDITRRVLDNSIAALKGQQEPLSKALSGQGVNITPNLPPSGTVPPEVTKALSSVGPGIHTLSDGSKWMKDATGNITRQ